MKRRQGQCRGCCPGMWLHSPGPHPASWASFLCLLSSWDHGCRGRHRIEKGEWWGREQRKVSKRQREKVRGRKRGKREKLEEAQQHQYFFKHKLSVESQDQYDRTPTCLTPIISLTLPLDDQQTYYPPCGPGVSHLQLIAQHSALATPNSQNKFRITYYHLFHLY